MPINPTYPGVYIQELPSGVHTITGVATSIAAFFGRASEGPIDKAVHVLCKADYVRNFGAPHLQSELARSVDQFFENGGTECYVIRLANGAVAAQVTICNLQGAPVLVAAAKSKGKWGENIRLEVDYNTTAPDETFNLRVSYKNKSGNISQENHINLSMDPESSRFAPDFVNNSSSLITLKLDDSLGAGAANDISANSYNGYSQSRRPLGDWDEPGVDMQSRLSDLFGPGVAIPNSRFQISVDDSPYVEVDILPYNIDDNAGTQVAFQTHLQDKINEALREVSSTASVTVTTASPAPNLANLLTISSAQGRMSSVHIRCAATNDVAAPLMLGWNQGGIEPARYNNFRPAPTASILRISNPGPGEAYLSEPENLNTLSLTNQNQIQSITIGDKTVDFPIELFTDAAATWVVSGPGFSDISENNDGVRQRLEIIKNAITNDLKPSYRAELWGYTLAIIATTGPVNTMPLSITTVATDIGAWFAVNLRQYMPGTAGVGNFIQGGVDGDEGVAPNADTYLGNENDQTGFHALDPVDLFNLMVLPRDAEVPDAVMMAVWGPAAVYCKQHRAFLLINPPAAWTNSDKRPIVIQQTALINNLRNLLGDAKDHAAVFYPQLTCSEKGLPVQISPCGAVAGVMARTDQSRGVWKAPAGTEASINAILDLEITLTDRENGVLNPLAVNCLRKSTSGFVNWGARTMDGNDDATSEWKYIPIRRLALFIEESLFRGTKWVVFEPNDEPLWAKIRLNVGAFMMRLFRQGAFQGSTPGEAYYVKCDRETTTQADRNLGIVNIEVGFAPLKPAEFVIIKIQQMTGEL